jgi:hypothetical protein
MRTPGISFCHLASATRELSTIKMVKTARTHHANNYYFLASDAAEDLSEIAFAFNCEYYHFTEKVGYPSYNLQKLLSWFERFKLACENCKTSHIMMMEDDVLITKPITIDDSWEMAGHDIRVGNVIPENIIDSIAEFSGKRPLTNQYGCGGGSIFKVSTFLDNYDRVIEWFKLNHDTLQKQYMPLGFMDCYMVVYYFLCGKDYSVNQYMTDSHHHINDGYDYDEFVERQPKHIEIVNNYKKYYWTL